MKNSLVLTLVAAATLLSGVSRADEKAECLAAASRGQTLRDAHALMEAREEFRVCARRTCPPIVQTDCGAWLEKVEEVLPSVVLSASDGDGRDLFDVRVSADGRVVAERLDGRAVPMNAGPYSFRFELPDGTSATLRALVKEGGNAQRVAAVVRDPARAGEERSPDRGLAEHGARSRLAKDHLAPLALGTIGIGSIAMLAHFAGRVFRRRRPRIGARSEDRRDREQSAAGDNPAISGVCRLDLPRRSPGVPLDTGRATLGATRARSARSA